MTKREQTAEELRAVAFFYAWTPEHRKEGTFRCRHREGSFLIDEKRCFARAHKPELFEDLCSKCPRWDHYRKLAEDPYPRRAYREEPA